MKKKRINNRPEPAPCGNSTAPTASSSPNMNNRQKLPQLNTWKDSIPQANSMDYYDNDENNNSF